MTKSRARTALAVLAALAAAAAAPAALWVYEAPDGRRLTEELPLFGDLVDAAKYVVDLETAKDDDPIFKRAVPMFEPGTHARRKTHHQLRLLGRSSTPDAANARVLSFQRSRSGTNWMKGKSFIGGERRARARVMFARTPPIFFA